MIFPATRKSGWRMWARSSLSGKLRASWRNCFGVTGMGARFRENDTPCLTVGQTLRDGGRAKRPTQDCHAGCPGKEWRSLGAFAPERMFDAAKMKVGFGRVFAAGEARCWPKFWANYLGVGARGALCRWRRRSADLFR